MKKIGFETLIANKYIHENRDVKKHWIANVDDNAAACKPVFFIFEMKTAFIY